LSNQKSQINDKHNEESKTRQTGSGIDENIILLSMGAGFIDDFIRNILSSPFCPHHFVHTILSNTNLSVYHFVHVILSVPFCLLPFCPRTDSSINQAINQSVKIYIAPLQDPYSEAQSITRYSLRFGTSQQLHCIDFGSFYSELGPTCRCLLHFCPEPARGSF